jgi:hypothetical protein
MSIRVAKWIMAPEVLNREDLSHGRRCDVTRTICGVAEDEDRFCALRTTNGGLVLR